MQSKILDDFVEYAKREFDCDIIAKASDASDTFESIFGGSFLNQIEVVTDFFEGKYLSGNVFEEVEFIVSHTTESIETDSMEIEDICDGRIELAA